MYKKQTFEFLEYPLFQVHFSRSDGDNHRIEKYNTSAV